MADYAMLNCWDDKNRGDLGIMLATVEKIKLLDPDAHIIGISSFNNQDTMFKSCHKILKKYIAEMYPAIFGSLGMNLFGKYRKSIIIKLIAFFIESLRYGAISTLPNKIAFNLLTKSEKKTINRLTKCNVSFSKGGSVFTDYETFRGKIMLIRLCRFFMLLKKFGCPYYILGQSFGPVKDKFAIHQVNKVICNAEKIYIREIECVKKYRLLCLQGRNVIYSGDAAFMLSRIPVQDAKSNATKIKVGFTFRRPNEYGDEYEIAMREFIEHLIQHCNCLIHIFIQVCMENEPDINTSERILDSIDRSKRNNIVYHSEELLPQELCWYYGQMDAIIGTRLHSTIFAMTAGTPVIGFAYHGTKMQGIFEKMGIKELVIQGKITSTDLTEKYIYLQNHYNEIKEKIKIGVKNECEAMEAAINDIVEYALKRNGENE